MTRSYSNYVQLFICCIFLTSCSIGSYSHLCPTIYVYLRLFRFCQIYFCHMCFFSFQSNSLILFKWNIKIRTPSFCSNENEIVRALPSCSNEMNCLNSLISFKSMRLLRITFLFLSSFLICSNDKEIIWNFLFVQMKMKLFGKSMHLLRVTLFKSMRLLRVTSFISVQLSYLFKWKWKLFELSHLVQMKMKSFGKSMRLLRVTLFKSMRLSRDILFKSMRLSRVTLFKSMRLSRDTFYLCRTFLFVQMKMKIFWTFSSVQMKMKLSGKSENLMCVCYMLFCSKQCVMSRDLLSRDILFKFMRLFKWKWKLFEPCSNLCVCSRDILFKSMRLSRITLFKSMRLSRTTLFKSMHMHTLFKSMRLSRVILLSRKINLCVCHASLCDILFIYASVTRYILFISSLLICSSENENLLNFLICSNENEVVRKIYASVTC